jgi:hypothetical protein
LETFSIFGKLPALYLAGSQIWPLKYAAGGKNLSVAFCHGESKLSAEIAALNHESLLQNAAKSRNLAANCSGESNLCAAKAA